MTEPTTTIETVKITQQTTATSTDGGKTVLTQSTSTTTEVLAVGSAGVITETILDEEEGFYEEIEEDEDHGATQAPDLPEEEPDDGRGTDHFPIKGVVRDAQGKPIKTKEK